MDTTKTPKPRGRPRKTVTQGLFDRRTEREKPEPEIVEPLAITAEIVERILLAETEE
jgi:hypothetical protein